MKDLTIALDNRPGALAEMGDALGRAGVSIEGGGAFLVNGKGVVAHFLFEDGAAARDALEAAGISVLEEQVLYSDHDHQLILVVDDLAKGRAVSEGWTREQSSGVTNSNQVD
ncbi:MAG TPA: hypothetical protein VE977_15830 [Pyrinomonadaceae bacterium]|nr:hypothetical protein [Pyrinomonadaceae bacterium]